MTQRCIYCRKKIELGDDAVAAQLGVLGPRGFVPLEKPMIHCGEECLSQHLSEAPDAPVRFP